MSNLMGRAGFNLLTIDVDEVKVAYPSMWELLEDLQDMGESNAVIGRYVLSSTPSKLSHHSLSILQTALFAQRYHSGSLGDL